MSQTSIEWLALKLSSFTAVLGAFAGIFGVAALIFSNWAGRLKDQALDRYKEESKERTALLERDATIARLELARLQSTVAPRRLSTSQRNELTELHRKFGAQAASIWYHVGDKEAETFSWEIATALHRSSWEIMEPASFALQKTAGIPFSESTSRLPTGVCVSHGSADISRTIANTLVDALTSFGFDANAELEEKRDDICITVEARPEGPQGTAKQTIATP